MAKQEQRRVVTRNAILDAASRAFGECSYSAVSIDQIAEQAGVAKGAIYHHFASKNVLFEAVLEQVSTAILAEVATALFGATDFWSSLAIGNRAFFVACSDKSRRQILLHDGPAVLGWERWRRIDQRNFGGLLKIAIAAAIDQELIVKKDPEILVRMLLGMVTEAAVSAAESSDFMAAAEHYIDVIDCMIAGLAIQHR